MYWEDLWEVGLRLWNSNRSMKINGRNIWKLLRSKTRCFLASPRNPARAAKSRISIGSGQISKKLCNSSSEYSSEKSYPNSSLSRDSNWDTSIRPSGHKDKNKLDQIVNNNTKTNKDQLNDAIYNETTFDTSRFNSSSRTRDPLPVVNITLWGGKKHRSAIVSGLTWLWDSGATDSIIKRKRNKQYEHKIRYNKV